MMPAPEYSVLLSILFSLSLLPAVVNSYDCSQLVKEQCQGPGGDFPTCLVSQIGASAFIQCASQNGAPDFTTTDSDGDSETVPPLDVLTQALSIPACDGCPLADNIQRVIMNTAPSPDFVNFGANLCNQIHPVDAGMCCLKKCLSGTPERSIQAFCNGDVNDLMRAPLLPDNCVSNAVSSDEDSGDSGSSGGGSDDSGSSGNDPLTAAASSGGEASSTLESLGSSSNPTQVPTSSTTSRIASSAETTSMTTSPTPQATPNMGIALRFQASYVDRAKRLAVAVLPILAVF